MRMKNIKKCVICAAIFEAPPSSKKITCSKACSKMRKSASHAGKSNVWSADSREKLSERGQTGNLKRGAEVTKILPHTGAFETNKEAKVWLLLSPDNIEYKVRNLALFCRENPQLWDGTSTNAYAGLRQIQAWLCGKRKRKVSTYKGWQLLEIAEK